MHRAWRGERAGRSATAASSSNSNRSQVMVAPVTGAPSDGNRQLYSGMRRALGSSKIVIVDTAGPDIFTVVARSPDRSTIKRPSSSSNGS